MPDGFVRMRKGEKRPVFGQETLAAGTLTISASPAPAVTLYNASGTVVTGFNGIAATGYDTGAQTAPRVWFTLDTATLAAGFYTLVFTFTASASDGTNRIYSPCVEIQVLDVTG